MWNVYSFLSFFSKPIFGFTDICIPFLLDFVFIGCDIIGESIAFVGLDDTERGLDCYKSIANVYMQSLENAQITKPKLKTLLVLLW